jgi:polar amino acid transport system substrate-binding protein
LELVRVAVDPNRPPYQFWSEGRLTGFNVDLIDRIATLQGVRIVLLPMDREECSAALADGRADAVLGYPYSPGASETVGFSEPLAASSIGILVPREGSPLREGLANLTDGVLALTRDSQAYDFLKSIRVIRFNETAVPGDAFELLVRGRADAFLEDRMTILYLLQDRKDRDRFKFSASYWLPVEYTMAVGKDRPYLLYLINTGLREMKNSGVYSALFERWFHEEEYETRRRLARLLTGFITVVLFSALLGSVSVWWTRQLSFRVRARTEDLHRANEELTKRVYETMDQKEFINQILESSPRGLVTCDAAGIITVCNTRAREIGRMEGDPLGERYDRYPLLSRFLGGKVAAILSEGRQYLFDTEEWARDDGAVLHIRYSLYPLRNHDQEIEGVIFSFEDHTRQKALQDQSFEREKNAPWAGLSRASPTRSAIP